MTPGSRLPVLCHLIFLVCELSETDAFSAVRSVGRCPGCIVTDQGSTSYGQDARLTWVHGPECFALLLQIVC